MDPSGGSVVHSEGRLIPHEFPITDLQQISGLDGIGRITCTVSSGTARFHNPHGALETDGVTQVTGQSAAALLLNAINVDTFQNRDVVCDNEVTNIFYLFLSSSNNRKSICIIHTVRKYVSVLVTVL